MQGWRKKKEGEEENQGITALNKELVSADEGLKSRWGVGWISEKSLTLLYRPVESVETRKIDTNLMMIHHAPRLQACSLNSCNGELFFCVPLRSVVPVVNIALDLFCAGPPVGLDLGDRSCTQDSSRRVQTTGGGEQPIRSARAASGADSRSCINPNKNRSGYFLTFGASNSSA